MGNRAVITTRKDWESDGVGIYLHWNGGRESVEAFLRYCELKGYRSPDKDCYGWARLCQVIGNFFGGTNSVGINTLWNLDYDNGDNGTYIIEGWKIVDRLFEADSDVEYDLTDALVYIDDRMPEGERIGHEFLQGKPVPVGELKIGDMVYIKDYDGSYSVHTIVGFGPEKVVNGHEVYGMPYVNRWGHADPTHNINNYLQEDAYVLHHEQEAE